MNRAQNKAERLIQIENLLLAHPEGMTQAEIARRLHVDRSTINRYVADVPKHIYIEDDGRWKIDRTADLINVRLNLHDALAVHLAARLLATRFELEDNPGNDKFYVNCAGCDREIEFGWSQPNRGGVYSLWNVLTLILREFGRNPDI